MHSWVSHYIAITRPHANWQLHKVLTFVEYRAVSASSKILTPHPPPRSECVLPPHQRRGLHAHSPGGEGGWGTIFRKTHDIGLASYTIISLRAVGSAEVMTTFIAILILSYSCEGLWESRRSWRSTGWSAIWRRR